MKCFSCLSSIAVLMLSRVGYAQADTVLIHNCSSTSGVPGFQIAKWTKQHYYLWENQMFSFPETNGVRTNGYTDMTTWDSKLDTEGNLREVLSGVDVFVMNYRLLKPANYYTFFTGRYQPLVIVLQGLPERGNCEENKCYHSKTRHSPTENFPAACLTRDHELVNNDYNIVLGSLNYFEASLANGNYLPDDANVPPPGFPGSVVFPQNLNDWDVVSVEDVNPIRVIIK